VTQQIIIGGAGFAGLWAAISAARAVHLAGRQADVQITVVSPAPELHIRPRLYEAARDEMSANVADLLDAVGAVHVKGLIVAIDVDARKVAVVDVEGRRRTLQYDRFVLATGSQLFLPDIPGLKAHAFDVDQLASARVLDKHLRTLPQRPESSARNTFVVAGGGFTGIETATELPGRLRDIFGPDGRFRVVLLEAAPVVGPGLGPGPRPVIEEALKECGVELMTSNAVASIDAGGVVTAHGERIDSLTVIWTAGMRASPLAAQIPGERDRLGRVHADPFLRAMDALDVFVAGDTAHAATDDQGNVASMSLQHALSLGRVAGHNAAAELVGLPLHPYSQPKYVTCLDLGAWGAVYTEGWERTVKLTGDVAKAAKREINSLWIYPPAADRDLAFAMANPDFVIVP
jgi:NADH dehydrogenase